MLLRLFVGPRGEWRRRARGESPGARVAQVLGGFSVLGEGSDIRKP